MKKIINIFFSGELNKEEKPRNHYEKSNPDLRILRSFALSLRSRNLVVNKAIAKFMCDQRPGN